MRGPEVTGKRHVGLALASFMPADVTNSYVDWLRDTQVTAFTEVNGEGVSLDGCVKYVTDNLNDPRAVLWRILTRSHGHVGNMRMSLDPRHCRGELALIVGRTDLHGQGIGRGAIALALGYAFGTLGLNKVTCGLYASNIASHRAFAAAGFFEEGRFARHVLVNGEFEDTLRLAIFSEAYFANNSRADISCE